MYFGDLNYNFLDEKKCAPLVRARTESHLQNQIYRKKIIPSKYRFKEFILLFFEI
jgi:hypothetical protein